MAKGFHETTNRQAETFHNSLDDRNAGNHARHLQNSKTSGKVPVCHPFHPSANAQTDRELPLGLYSRAEKRILPLTCKLEMLYFLE
jgi:hypothetical protein